MATKKDTRGVKRAAAGTKRSKKKTAASKKPASKKAGARKPVPVMARKAGRTKSPGGAVVLAWQDDPISGLAASQRPVPNLSKSPLKFKFKGPSVPPGLYQIGTPQFRYWTAAEALRRGADFWASLLKVKTWEPGPTLTVGLDEGVDLNAYYNREELAFFHDTVSGQVIYSGESPDVVCHEMGHACLDAHRPELFDAPFAQVAAFHESFGDMSAILSALQLLSVRNAALKDIVTNSSSQLSRCAEQLGYAIRQGYPTAVDKNCLRDACNKFKFVDPKTLPNSAPANRLSSEPHSFSRVFTGAFYELLGGMVNVVSSKPSEAALTKAATDCAKLLLDATTAAPVQPDYYAQVAAHMIDADTSHNAGKYRSVLTSVFVGRLILPPAAVAALPALGRSRGGGRTRMGATAGAVREAARGPAQNASLTASLSAPSKTEIHTVRLSANDLGLGNGTLLVDAPVEKKTLLSVSAAMIQEKQSSAENVDAATQHFVEMLVAHDRIEKSPAASRRSIVNIPDSKSRRRTHVLVPHPEGLKLVRRQFDCSRCS